MPTQSPLDQIRFGARRDALDFRDRMFEPTLVEVPQWMPVEEYLSVGVPVLHQGSEFSCTGFALATVAHFLLRKRKVAPDLTPVSPRMAYEMAKRYDEYPGERYEGSTTRGALKGWHKAGLCSDAIWPYRARRLDRRFSTDRALEAANRPLGAYYRVNHLDLVALHAALAEVGILYAAVGAHKGWKKVKANGVIPYDAPALGGHAVAVVAYDDRGFWLHNSWGTQWGREGLGYLSYDDWLESAMDAWVARLGAPVRLMNTETGPETSAKTKVGPSRSTAMALGQIRPHVICIDDEGLPESSTILGTSEDDLHAIFEEEFGRITQHWKQKRILVIATPGLRPHSYTVQRMAMEQRAALIQMEIYPLILLWRPSLWDRIASLTVEQTRARRGEGGTTSDYDFMLNRLNDALEPLVRAAGGRVEWQERLETALGASAEKLGALRLIAGHLVKLTKVHRNLEVHLLGYSAGALLLAPFVQLLTTRGKIAKPPLRGRKGLGLNVASCTLWAPANTIDSFRATFEPALLARTLRRLRLYTLTPDAERTDSCGNYRGSLLKLISNALEAWTHIPGYMDGVPLLGLAESVQADDGLRALVRRRLVDHIQTPNMDAPLTPCHSTARRHGDFDSDLPTAVGTIAAILGTPLLKHSASQLTFSETAEASARLRHRLNR